MTRNKIIPYNPKLKTLARELRKNSTVSEVILWNKIKGKSLGYQFHRQVPIDEYIVDFYCHELLLAIEIDGSSHDYNFEYDDQRQKKLELFGIEIVRFLDRDIKQGLNDVLRILEICVEERSSKKETTPPCPPQGGNLQRKTLPKEREHPHGPRKGELESQDASVKGKTPPCPPQGGNLSNKFLPRGETATQDSSEKEGRSH